MLIALRGLLAKEGYQVETASSGEEALRRIETGSFHLVITDLSMDGRRAACRCSSAPARSTPTWPSS